MRVNAFQVCNHDFAVKAVAVRACVGDNGVGDFILVVADELVSASRALLLVAHAIYSSRLRHAPFEER